MIDLRNKAWKVPASADFRRTRRLLDEALRRFQSHVLTFDDLVSEVFWLGVRHGKRMAADDLDRWSAGAQDRRHFKPLLATLKTEILRTARE